MTTISTYFEVEPENNIFQDVVIDVTHRCNMICKNCYLPNRDVPDMDIDMMLDTISRLPDRTMIRIIGAEPTMRNDLDKIITGIRQAGHRMTLLTNGLRLSRLNYVEKLKAAGLRHCYISMNGADNDDWYRAIDEMPCAHKKVAALENLVNQNFIIDVGCIIVKGVNDNAIESTFNLWDRIGLDNGVLRIKNVGDIGRSMETANHSMDDLIDLCVAQTGLSRDYIESWREVPIYKNTVAEKSTFMFPLDAAAADKMLHRSGRWIKITDWQINDEGVPGEGGKHRVGRITPDFKIAPFFDHIKENEGGY